MYQLTQVSDRSNMSFWWFCPSVLARLFCNVSCGSCSWFRLSVGVWEDRAVLARLKQKLQTEDGRLILRIEQEEWKVTCSTQEVDFTGD